MFNVPLPPWSQKKMEAGLKDEVPSWALSGWFPRHFEMVFLADLYRQMAQEKGIAQKVLSLGCGEGFIEYLLALEGISVLGIDKDDKTLARASTYQKSFNRMRSNLGLESTLEYTHKHFGKVDLKKEFPDHRMMLANWIGPGEDEQTHDLRRYVAKPEPEMVVISGEWGNIMDNATPINMSHWGYHYVVGWYSVGCHIHALLAPHLGLSDSSEAVVEVWAKERTRSLSGLNFKKVPPYEWEADMDIDRRMPAYRKAEVYVLRNDVLDE